MLLKNVVRLSAGSPQFRIRETDAIDAPVYNVYTQSDLDDDLTGLQTVGIERKQIRTDDEVTTLNEGDVLFSLISGTAVVITRQHVGFMYTQNYVLITPKQSLDAAYLVYLLNNDRMIARQFRIQLQGTMVLKYTLAQIRELKLPPLPEIPRQQLIGSIYLKQLRLQALQKRVADNEKLLRLAILQEVS